MSQVETPQELVELHVENIGGIDETTVELTPGVTILTGRNATNRTSLLQALMAALGSDQVTLNAEADEGSVELTIGGATYTRTLRRKNDTVVMDGDPYLDDATLADLFAFLLESNEARRAVAAGDDLRDIIMRPVDTHDIESKISELQDQIDEIEDEIDEISELKRRIPELEEKKSELEKEISTKKDKLSELEKNIGEKDAEVEPYVEKREEIDDKLDELGSVRSDLERVRRQIDTQKDSIDALEDERDDIETELDEFDAIPEQRMDEIDAEISRLRSQRTSLDETLDQLQSVIEFNQSLLDGDLDPFTELHDDDTDDSTPTDQLLEDGNSDDLVCWTCGRGVTTEQIETMLERFRDLHSQYMDERATLDEEIDSLQADQSELEERRQKRDQLQSRLQQIHTELDERTDQLADLQDRRDELVSEVDQLEDDVENLRSGDDHSDLIDLHKEANQLEVEIDRLDDDLTDVVDEIERYEARIAERDQLEAQRDEFRAEIEDLRTKIDRIEESAIEQFNDHMETVLDILDYDNLERIWLERTEREERQGRRKVTTTHFDLHVVRTTSDGAVYEDDIEHLSESEREVTGLVFALAGYLAHDLHADLPFMLLDSVEAIDPGRLASLVDHLTDYTDYLVATLLEDDARALDSDYQRIADI